jgi:hypothetical protein
MSKGNNILIDNIEKMHTTDLGNIRINKNTDQQLVNCVEWCKKIVLDTTSVIERKGKNWYVSSSDFTITVNADNYSIITVHKNSKHS